MNPQHTVPTLDDNGTVIWDSHAITTYLVGKYAKNDALYPKDLVQRARVDQRLHFDSGVLFANLRGVFFPIFRSGATEVDQERLDAWYAGLDLLESFLQTDKYLVGNAVTLADITSVTTVHTGKAVFGLDAQKYPKISAWVERLFQLPYINDVSGKISGTFLEFFNGKLAANKAAKQ